MGIGGLPANHVAHLRTASPFAVRRCRHCTRRAGVDDMSIAKTSSTEYRLSVLSRVVAASLGAYAVVNLANMALAFLLPAEQYKDLLFAMQISFLFYTLVIIWVFAVRIATKAWLGLLAVALPLALIDVYFYSQGVGT